MADDDKGPEGGGGDPASDQAKNDIGNRTMQLDAYVGELQEAGADVPGDAVLAEIISEHSGGAAAGTAAPIVTSLPPPLPPKKASKVMIGLGVGVVLVAIVAGVYVGSLVLGGAGAPAARPETETTPAAHPDEDPVSVPIELDTVVVGAGDEEGEAPEEPAPEEGAAAGGEGGE